ncbi:MAG TPA: sugar phosphate isomerase/epimerase [Gemmataceae bacterium]|nr:sugar phosphate isomerase/epimerase [Gemmataceae bacterium]
MHFLSRREFLGSSAALALGSVALSKDPPAAPTPPPALHINPATAAQMANDPFDGFAIGMQSYTFRNFNLEQALVRTADLGLRHIELYNGHLPTNASDAQIEAAKNLMRQHHITPFAFGVEHFSNNDAANRRLFEFARKLGIRNLTADPDPNSFDSLDRLCEEFDINIAIHPHGPQGARLHRWYSAEVILDAVRSHNRRIGTCLDTGHLIHSAIAPFNRHLDPAQQVRAMGARNFGIHLKDHNNMTERDVVFGRDGGVLNVLSVLQALRDVNFRGYISIEYEANAANPTPDVRACLDVLKESVRQMNA